MTSNQLPDDESPTPEVPQPATPQEAPASIKLPKGFEEVDVALLREQAAHHRPGKARLTVVAHAHHIAEGQVQTAEIRCGMPLETAEQPWQRWFTAKPGWHPLECGWLGDGGESPGASLLVLTVAPGKSSPVTVGVSKDKSGGVVKLCVIPPGLGMMLPCPCLGRLLIQGDGLTRCQLMLMPR